jgi:hypothetical protein
MSTSKKRVDVFASARYKVFGGRDGCGRGGKLRVDINIFDYSTTMIVRYACLSVFHKKLFERIFVLCVGGLRRI